uniref:Complexin 4 n=1 Tax=Ornithorhynchus anatinus TaxID=9258 RepID=A0A6I8NYS4_ORNAN
MDSQCSSCDILNGFPLPNCPYLHILLESPPALGLMLLFHFQDGERCRICPQKGRAGLPPGPPQREIQTPKEPTDLTLRKGDLYLFVELFPRLGSEMDENQIQMAGDDVDLPEDLQKMVDEDQGEEEDKDSILGQLQNLQNMDMNTLKEKAQATFTEIKQTAEQKCSMM